MVEHVPSSFLCLSSLSLSLSLSLLASSFLLLLVGDRSDS